MEQVSVLIRRIEKATPKELGVILDAVNGEVYSENDWNTYSVKSSYVSLLAAIESEVEQYKLLLLYGNETVECVYGSGREEVFNVRQTLGNLELAHEYFQNPPVLQNPSSIDANAINWNGRDIFTAEEAKALLGVSDSTYKRWVNDGWLSETQMEGSNKRWVLKDELLAFMKNEKIFKKSWR